MAGVVGDVEAEEFLVLVFFFVVEQGEDETVVGLFVVGFPVFFAPIDECLFFDFFSCCHREMDALPYLVVLGIEGAGKGEDGEHVVVAIVAFVMVFGEFAVTIEEFLPNMALAARIGVPHFIDGVVPPFEGAFAEVEGYELGGDVGDEGVAHGEDGVAPLVGGEEQVVAQGCLSFVLGCLDGVVGCSAFYPDEFPVEVEVVGEPFACLEGCVFGWALGAGG